MKKNKIKNTEKITAVFTFIGYTETFFDKLHRFPTVGD